MVLCSKSSATPCRKNMVGFIVVLLLLVFKGCIAEMVGIFKNCKTQLHGSRHWGAATARRSEVVGVWTPRPTGFTSKVICFRQAGLETGSRYRTLGICPLFGSGVVYCSRSDSGIRNVSFFLHTEDPAPASQKAGMGTSSDAGDHACRSWLAAGHRDTD